MRVYVGEADLLSTRIGQHYSGPSAKEFWTRAVAFSSTNDNLNKAHVRHIEARLVGLAQAAVGIDAFTPAPAKGTAGQPQLQLKVKSIVAHGQEASEGFVVFAGSRASMSESRAIHTYVQTLREHLVGSGVLVPDGDAFA
jgi:hypothetical protein